MWCQTINVFNHELFVEQGKEHATSGWCRWVLVILTLYTSSLWWCLSFACLVIIGPPAPPSLSFVFSPSSIVSLPARDLCASYSSSPTVMSLPSLFILTSSPSVSLSHARPSVMCSLSSASLFFTTLFFFYSWTSRLPPENSGSLHPVHYFSCSLFALFISLLH